MTRLNEIDRTEALDVGRALNPSYTAEAFDRDWARFVKLKAYILKRREMTAARKRFS